MSALMEDLLSLAKVGQVERPIEPIAPGEIVSEVLHQLSPQLSCARVRVEVFYRGTTAKEKKGTGIGLATIQKIARYYDGRAWVEETPGGGSTFWVEMMDVEMAAKKEEDKF